MKPEIIARLSIKGLSEMNSKELKTFRRWLVKTTEELINEKDLKIFAKNYRATLYK